MGFRCDLWHDRRKNEREDLQEGSMTCYDVCFGDCGTNKKTGGRFKDVKIFSGLERRACRGLL